MIAKAVPTLGAFGPLGRSSLQWRSRLQPDADTHVFRWTRRDIPVTWPASVARYKDYISIVSELLTSFYAITARACAVVLVRRLPRL
jgi:hypothetical protein